MAGEMTKEELADERAAVREKEGAYSPAEVSKAEIAYYRQPQWVRGMKETPYATKKAYEKFQKSRFAALAGKGFAAFQKFAREQAARDERKWREERKAGKKTSATRRVAYTPSKRRVRGSRKYPRLSEDDAERMTKKQILAYLRQHPEGFI